MRISKYALTSIWVTLTPLNKRGRTNEFRFQWAEKRPLLARRRAVRYMHTECIFYAGLKHLSLPFQLGSLDKGGALFPMHLAESS